MRFVDGIFSDDMKNIKQQPEAAPTPPTKTRKDGRMKIEDFNTVGRMLT
jgi:hypothetical protein